MFDVAQKIKKDKKGFSYGSPSAQRNIASKYLGVEAGVIFVTAIGILIVLNYFNILPFSSIPSFFGLPSSKKPGYVQKQPSDSKADTIVPVKLGVRDPHFNPTITLDKNIIPSTAVLSDIPKYQLSFKNKEAFEKLLKEFPFWGRTYPLDEKNEKRSEPITKLLIHLTDKVQPANQFTNPKVGLYMSTGTRIEGDKLHLMAYMSPSTLSEKNKDKFLEQLIIQAVYRMSSPGDVISQQKALNDIYGRLNKSQITIFSIN